MIKYGDIEVEIKGRTLSVGRIVESGGERERFIYTVQLRDGEFPSDRYIEAVEGLRRMTDDDYTGYKPQAVRWPSIFDEEDDE